MTHLARLPHTSVLANSVESRDSAGHDRRRHAYKAQGLIKLLTGGEAPFGIVFERGELWHIIILFVQEQLTVGHDRVGVLPIRIGKEDAEVFRHRRVHQCGQATAAVRFGKLPRFVFQPGH
jgi:hypothetical protein